MQNTYIWWMRFFATLFFTGFFLHSCVSSKTEAEFNEKKPSVAVIVDQSSAIEKKHALNVLVPEYVTSTPKDSLLLAIFNSYLLFYLDDIGYKVLFTRDQHFKPEFVQGMEMVYAVKTGTLPFREFIHKEYVPNGAAKTQTVRMHGIEVNPWAEIALGIDNPDGNKEVLRVTAHAQKEETQQGEFKQTYGVRDVVSGNSQASVKYIYNVSKLEDGVFQNLCVEGAKELARSIDHALKRLYQKQQKEKKKHKG